MASVKLPKSFVAINLSEKVPGAFGLKPEKEKEGADTQEAKEKNTRQEDVKVEEVATKNASTQAD